MDVGIIHLCKKKKQIKMVLVFKAHPFLALSLSLGLLYFL